MKSLETEYKNLIMSEVPDLWDKIDTGLVSKRPVKVTVSKKKTIFRILPFAVPAAAAALIGLIVLPNVLNNKTKTAINTESANYELAMSSAEMEEARKVQVDDAQINYTKEVACGAAEETEDVVCEEAEKVIKYAFITDIIKKDNKVFIKYITTNSVEQIFKGNSVYQTELSKESQIVPEKEKTYIMEFDEEGLLILKENTEKN